MPIDIPTTDSSTGISSQLNWRVVLLKPSSDGAQAVAQNLSDIVTYIQDNARGAQGNQGSVGWSPVLALESDGMRRIAKIVDWTGSTGTKPAIPDPAYIGATGTVQKASAIDLRGPAGGQGAQGLYVLEVYIFAAAQPDTPTGGTVDVSEGTVTAPAGWSATIPTSNPQNHPLWIARTSVNPVVRTADYTPTWSATFEAGSTGATGEQGEDGKYRVYVYRAAATTPTATGGVYTAASDSFTTPTSWATTPPALSGSERLWEAWAQVDPGGTSTQNLTWTIRAISGTTGPRGHDGKYKVEVYQAGATAPSASGGVYTVSSDTFTAPSGWATTPPNVPSGQRLYIARAEVDPSGAATQNLTWVVAAFSGERGQQGIQGQSQIRAYHRAATKPSAPTGGTIQISDGTLSTAPTGWFASPPVGTDNLWISETTFNPAVHTADYTPTNWGDPEGAGLPGAPGTPGKRIAFVYQTAASAPAISGGGYVPNTDVLTVPTGWSASPTALATGQHVWVSATNLTPGSSTATATPTWSTPQQFSGATGAAGTAGTSGTDGVAGSDGADGKRPAFVFQTASSAPAITGGSYTPSTDTLTAPASWSLTPTAPASGQHVYVSMATLTPSTSTTPVTPTWSTVRQFSGPPGAAGATGSRGKRDVFVFQTAATEPSISGGSYVPNTDTLTVPASWSASPTALATGQHVWVAKTTVTPSTSGTSVTPTWSSPQQFSGPAGSDGSAGGAGNDGAAGKRAAFVFQTAATAPAISGGSYTPSTDTLTAPTGWSLTPTASASGQHIFVSMATLTPSTSSVAVTPTWSTVRQFSGAKGADGSLGLTLVGSVTGITSSNQDFAKQGGGDLTRADIGELILVSFEYTLTTRVSRSSYVVRKEELAGTSAYYITIDNTNATQACFRFSSAADSGILRVLASSDVSFTLNARVYNIAGGTQGDPGVAGADGKRVVFVYQTAATAPAITGGSYTPSTDTLTAPASWDTAPTARADGQHIWVSSTTLTPSSSSTAVTPTWSTVRQWSGADGARGADGSLGLSLVGQLTGLTSTYQNVVKQGGGDLTRADISNIFLVDLDYTRTNAGLRMSGIVRKSDVSGTNVYHLQIQGSGGDYITLQFNADSDAGILRIQENSSTATSINARILNIGGGTKGDPGEPGRDANQGDWDAETTYEQYDSVQYDGSLYFRFGARIVGNASNDNPATDTDWRIMQGADATLPATVSQAQAEAGTGTDALMWTPQRVNQAIQALDPGTVFNDEALQTIERLQDIAGDFKYEGDVDDRWSPTARSGWGMVAHVPTDIAAYVAALTAAGAATDYAAGTAFTSLATGLPNDSVVLLEIPNNDAGQIDDARVRMYDDTVTGTPNHYLHFSGEGGFNYLGVSGTNRYYYLDIAAGWKLQLQHKLQEYVWLGGVEAEEVVEAFSLDPGATLPASAISGIEAVPPAGAETIVLSAVTVAGSAAVSDASIDTTNTESGEFLSDISTTSVTIAEGVYLMEVTFATTSTAQRGYPTLLIRDGTDVVGRTTSQYLRSTDVPQAVTLLGVLNLAADTAVRPAFIQLQYGTSLGGGIGGAVSITTGATIMLHPFSGSGVTIGGTGEAGGTEGSAQIKRELVGERTNRATEDPQPSSGNWYVTDIDIPDSDDILMLEIYDVNHTRRIMATPIFTTGKILRALTNQTGSTTSTNHALNDSTATSIGVRIRLTQAGNDDIRAYFGITSENKLLYGAINDQVNAFNFAEIRVWRVYADLEGGSPIGGNDLTSLQSVIKELHQVRLLTDDITLDYDSVATEWSVLPSSVVVGARFVATADLPADADAMNTYIAAAESRSPDVPAATNDGWRYDGYLLFRVNKDEDISNWRVAFQDNHSNFDWRSEYLPLGSFSPIGQDSSDTYDVYSIYDGQWPAEDNLDFERQGTAVLSVWHGEYDDDRLQAALTRSSGRQSEDSYLPQNSGSLSNMHVAWGGGHNPLIATDFAPKLLDFDTITPADAMGLGFDSTGSRIKLGSHDNVRGQLYWRDDLGVADPNRILLQFTISAAADTDHHYVIGVGTNSPDQPSENASWRGWNLFDSGIVLAYIPQETGLTGVHAFYMMATQDGVDGSTANWEVNTARLDAGAWTAVDGVARVTPSTTDAKANARLGMTGTTRLDATSRKSIAIEHFDRQTHLYINRSLIGIWNWSADRAPFRSSRNNRGYYYLVRSTAFERTLVSGTQTSPATYISEFAVSPARVQAAAPAYFR